MGNKILIWKKHEAMIGGIRKMKYGYNLNYSDLILNIIVIQKAVISYKITRSGIS